MDNPSVKLLYTKVQYDG